ncbi:hypothetical protein DESA109040_14090 [Deinococcus saxicola]|uniref:hypothetical protein n=1 Tax=Deinococcus saxicola TaxID=249406 RepID=UPI0039EF7C63
MSVIGYTAQEIKTLELATRALIPLELLLSPFGQLYTANADAYSRTYDVRRPLTDTERAERVTEYECAQGNPEHAALMDAPAVLSALHGLTWNCVSNEGEYPVSTVAEAARRAVVQSVAFECLAPGGRAARLSEWAYVRRLPDGENLSLHLQFLTTADTATAYRGQKAAVNGVAAGFHGQVAADRAIPRAFERAWAVHDLTQAQTDAELAAAFLAVERLGLRQTQPT